MSKSREAEFLPLDEIILEKQVPVYYPFFFLKNIKKERQKWNKKSHKAQA